MPTASPAKWNAINKRHCHATTQEKRCCLQTLVVFLQGLQECVCSTFTPTYKSRCTHKSCAASLLSGCGKARDLGCQGGLNQKNTYGKTQSFDQTGGRPNQKTCRAESEDVEAEPENTQGQNCRRYAPQKTRRVVIEGPNRRTRRCQSADVKVENEEAKCGNATSLEPSNASGNLIRRTNRSSGLSGASEGPNLRTKRGRRRKTKESVRKCDSRNRKGPMRKRN